jgi:hypothetical protein
MAITSASKGKTTSSRGPQTTTSSDTSGDGLKAAGSARVIGGAVAKTSSVPSSTERTLSSRIIPASIRMPVSSASSRAAASCHDSPYSM